MSLYDLKVGDRVQVFDQNGPRHGQPKGGWDGEVIKVGRKLITVKYSYGYECIFRLDTGDYNSKDYPHSYWIRTVEQAQDDLHRRELVETLGSHELYFKSFNRVPITTAKLEALVAVLEENNVDES